MEAGADGGYRYPQKYLFSLSSDMWMGNPMWPRWRPNVATKGHLNRKNDTKHVQNQTESLPDAPMTMNGRESGDLKL